MIYIWLGDNCRDLQYFQHLEGKVSFITMLWPGQKLSSQPMGLTTVDLLDPTIETSYVDLDWDFILQYPMHFTGGSLTTITYTYSYLVRLYYCFSKFLEPGDTVISVNSGEPISRLLKEYSVSHGIDFRFFEMFHFRDMFQMSSIPFQVSKYGNPYFSDLLSSIDSWSAESLVFLDEWRVQRVSRSEQDDSVKLDRMYDIFIPGQVPADTSIVLNTPVHKTSYDLARILRSLAQMDVLYKKHPGNSEEIEDLPVTYTNANVFECFDHCSRVVTISSTVGIEAELYGKLVYWQSNCPASRYELDTEEARVRFVEAARRYMFPLDRILDKLKEDIV